MATAAHAPKIMSEIVSTLLEYGINDEAAEFLKKFPAESQKSSDYEIAKFLVENTDENVSRTIDTGRSLLAAGIKDLRVYEVMIDRSLEAGLGSSVEDIVHEAMAKFPDQKARLEEIIAKHSRKN
jgi:hypothetical protein